MGLRAGRFAGLALFQLPSVALILSVLDVRADVQRRSASLRPSCHTRSNRGENDSVQIDSLVRCLCLATLPLLLTNCGRMAPDWDQFAASYLDGYFAAHPEIGVYAGRHEFDGKLSDLSRAGFERDIQRLRAARERASAFQAGELKPRQRFERDYLLFVIDRDLFWMEKARWPF